MALEKMMSTGKEHLKTLEAQELDWRRLTIAESIDASVLSWKLHVAKQIRLSKPSANSQEIKEIASTLSLLSKLSVLEEMNMTERCLKKIKGLLKEEF